MIYPPASASGSSGSRMRGSGAKTGGHVSGAGCAKGMRNGRKNSKTKQQQVVQWKQRNVQEGIVIVDELQLSKLIKRDPIQKFYDLDPEPFATGLFASVSRCRSRDTGQQFAAKFSSRARYGEDCSAEIHHEIALLSLCSPSSRVIRLHDVFETPAEIIIVLEFAPGGDMQTIIDDNLVPFEADVVKFVRQLVEGLAYLHERKIAHLDIKPQNLVMMADFPDCDVKLCDFEISRVIIEGIEIREILGTPDYVAPEILHYEPITLKADMWSLGVTTYVLLTGFSPFGGETDQETFCNISRAEVDFPEELFEDVSEEAQDFIRRLLVRDPGARPTAKECLRHKWLSKKIPRTSTPPPSLLRHDSSLLVTKTTPRTASPSDDSRRVSPHNVTQQQKNLRKYLSKSREALFERVVQQQHQKNNLRKTTLMSQYHKTRRLCESQMSLVSKSRERLLMMEQHQMSPYFSRSREKLYGLRSLSKSHEVLDLCKTAAAAGGQTPQGVGLGILKTLTRATTADLSMIPLLRQRLMGHGSSTTSISSSVTIEQDNDEPMTSQSSSEHTTYSRMSSLPASVIQSPITPTPIVELLENSAETPNRGARSPVTKTTIVNSLENSSQVANNVTESLVAATTIEASLENSSEVANNAIPLPVIAATTENSSEVTNNANKLQATTMENTLENSSEVANNISKLQATTMENILEPPLIATPAKELEKHSSQKPLALIKCEPITQVPALLSPKLLKETIRLNFGMLSKTVDDIALSENEANMESHEEQTLLPTDDPTVLPNENTTASVVRKINEARKYSLDNPETDYTPNNKTSTSYDFPSYQGDKTTEDHDKNLKEGNELEDEYTQTSMKLPRTQQDLPDTPKTITEEKVNEESENSKKCEDETEEDSEEPRFTVAQLVSAFNRHQEVVTKTSLEVTMTTSDKETKLPPIIFNAGDSKFPTGPNALRLFIPGIDISNEPPKRKQKRKSNLGIIFPNESDQKPATNEEASNETVETFNDIYQMEDDESFQSLESTSSLTTNEYDSITNLLLPEDLSNEEQIKKPEDKTSTNESKYTTTAVNWIAENVDSTNNNNNNQNDYSSAVCKLVVEPPTVHKAPHAEHEEFPNNDYEKIQLPVEVTPNYLRSGSLSSDTSVVSSEGSSSMSWEELTPPNTATPTGIKNEPHQWPQKKVTSLSPGQRQTSRSRSPSVTRESWGRICTGTYNRAMEKFNSKATKQENTVPTDPNRRPNRKSLTMLSPPEMINPSEKVRRKSISVIKQFS